jgi:hypothetical protein
VIVTAQWAWCELSVSCRRRQAAPDFSQPSHHSSQPSGPSYPNGTPAAGHGTEGLPQGCGACRRQLVSTDSAARQPISRASTSPLPHDVHAGLQVLSRLWSRALLRQAAELRWGVCMRRQNAARSLQHTPRPPLCSSSCRLCLTGGHARQGRAALQGAWEGEREPGVVVGTVSACGTPHHSVTPGV